MKLDRIHIDEIITNISKNTYYPRPEVITISILQKFYSTKNHIPLLLYSNCTQTYHSIFNAKENLHRIIEDEIIREHRYKSLNITSPTSNYFYMLNTVGENVAVLYIFQGVHRRYIRIVIDNIVECLELLKIVITTIDQKTSQDLLNKNKNLIDSFKNHIFNPFHKLCFREDIIENNHIISQVIQDFNFEQRDWTWASIGRLHPFSVYKKN